MLLTADVSQAELAELIGSLTPVRISIDEKRGRSITLGRPRVEFVPGRGLRLRGDARITWDVAGVSIPVTLQAWQVLLVPRVEPRGRSRVLAFEPVIEELDLKGVPAFLDGKIAGAISEGISQNRHKLAWDFGRALSKRIPLPTRISPARPFELVAAGGEVSVTESAMRLSVRFEAAVEKSAPVSVRRAEPPPASARFAPPSVALAR